MVKRSNGDVAIKWVLNRPAKTIKIAGTDRYYVPQYQYALAMMWVKPEDANQILSIREKSCNCPGAAYGPAFVPASLQDVSIWTTGDRHPKPDADYHEEN